MKTPWMNWSVRHDFPSSHITTKMSQIPESDREYRLIVLGDGGVGKSCLTLQFIQGVFMEDYDPTIEDSYRKHCVIDNELALLDILDTAGQDDYSAMREQYMRSGEGFLLVYSITSRGSFQAVKDFYQQILRTKDKDSFPVVLVANKSDLEFERQIPIAEGRELARRMNCPCIETSAKQKYNVDESFAAIVREIRKYNRMQQSGRPGGRSDSNAGTLGIRGGVSHDGEMMGAKCCPGCTIL